MKSAISGLATIDWNHMSLIGFFGIASGFPLMLTTSTLQMWLADQWPSLTTASLGSISLLGLPYLLKGLWSPFLDRYRVGQLAHREGWIACMQLTMGILFILMGCLPINHANIIIALAFLVVLASATQDAALDAHRIEQTERSDYGIAISSYQLGYRLAIMITGGGALVLAYYLNWHWVYIAAGLTCLSMSAYVFYRALTSPKTILQKKSETSWYQIWLHCFRLEGVKIALIMIMMLKISDAVIGNLAQVFFLKEMHLNVATIGILYKGIGLIFTVLGAVLAGFSLKSFSLRSNLWCMAFLQIIAIIPYIMCAFIHNHTVSWATLAIVCESLTSGMIGAACVMLLMLVCQSRYVATQYALLVLFLLLPRIALGLPAGWWVDHWGWLSFFIFALILACLPFIGFACKSIQVFCQKLEEVK